MDDIAVRSLARQCIALVERAFVLIDQHAVLVERLVAVAVELHREQALARAERVGRVDDDEVVFVLDAADVLEAVLIQDMDARSTPRRADTPCRPRRRARRSPQGRCARCACSGTARGHSRRRRRR